MCMYVFENFIVRNVKFANWCLVSKKNVENMKNTRGKSLARVKIHTNSWKICRSATMRIYTYISTLVTDEGLPRHDCAVF